MLGGIIFLAMNRGNYELTPAAAFSSPCQSRRLSLAENVAGMVNITYDKS